MNRPPSPKIVLTARGEWVFGTIAAVVAFVAIPWMFWALATLAGM
jgi:hypothetical protein